MTLGAEAEAKYRLWPWPPFLFPADTELEAEIYLGQAWRRESGFQGLQQTFPVSSRPG